MHVDHIESSHSFSFEDETGLLKSVTFAGSAESTTVSFQLKLTIEIGGTEQRSATGGLEYLDTRSYEISAREGDVHKVESSAGLGLMVPVEIALPNDVLRASMIYRLNRFGPALSVGIHFPGGQAVVVRNVRLTSMIDLGSDSWLVTAPGNCLASNTPMEVISPEVGLSSIGGLRGASGLIHLESDSRRSAIALWIDDDTEVPEIVIAGTSPNTMTVDVLTNFAADLDSQSNDVQLFSIDLSVPRFDSFPQLFAGWMRSRGLTSPGQPPEWSLGALIYEAQIGFSVFEETRHYSPYPEVDDLIADLDRIQAMGFSVIQLMPRQPYPSYNVHDYWDIDTSYGPIVLIKTLVAESHQRGMRVIFDVLLHGVLDQESIQTAADGVRSGPFAELLSSETSDSFGSDVKDWHNYLIAWSRHIADFEPYWKAGSPPISPLIAEHPDWFCRDSAGNVSGVYTKAFDPRNREWQDYFTSAMSFLMTELDIDGFRFDAPTYNEFANWAPWARGRASTSQLACVGLFERLRPVLKGIKSDALLYTEPSGHALRRSMDLNYNYDEQWLLTSLGTPSSATAWGVRSGKALAVWMRDRDALLPAGSLTAHHIDSHDTFWWPSWGKKWRREQFMMDQVRLFTVVFGGLPGPMMMFSGGEIGIEDLLPRLAAVKRGDVWRYGAVSWWSDDSTPDSVFGVTRRLGSSAISLVANIGSGSVSFRPSGVFLHGVVDAVQVLEVGEGARITTEGIALGHNSAVIYTHTIL
jgi:Alpha amylase, catalytic domain